jgi:predicted DNA-binding transcriptional regulator AlpA
MSPAEVRVWLAQFPAGTLVPAQELLARLSDAEGERPMPVRGESPGAEAPPTWRERLWTVPAETRLGVQELVEATGRSRDWVYRHTGPGGAGTRLPHRKMDGVLVFLAGEVRAWLAGNEEVVESAHPRTLRLSRS